MLGERNLGLSLLGQIGNKKLGIGTIDGSGAARWNRRTGQEALTGTYGCLGFDLLTFRALLLFCRGEKLMSRRSSRPSLILPLLLTLFYSLFAAAQAKPVDAEGHQWWQHAVFYEIYPRSFADSNNDGVGDIPGITSKLDYLRWLGVDAIWIAPMFPSPEVDWGYDVSDYYNVNPDYGTLKDMDALVAQGKQRDIRVLLDFVLTYTSDQNKWFRSEERRAGTE